MYFIHYLNHYHYHESSISEFVDFDILLGLTLFSTEIRLFDECDEL